MTIRKGTIWRDSKGREAHVEQVYPSAVFFRRSPDGELMRVSTASFLERYRELYS